MSDTKTVNESAQAQQQEENISWVDYWLVKPKLLYFVLNMYVYGFHAKLPFIFLKSWKLSLPLFALATTVMVSNFIGALVWGHMADKSGKYKSIINWTCIAYTITTVFLIFPLNQYDSNNWLTTLPAFVVLFFFNFFLSSAFPLVDAQIMAMLSSNPRVTRDQFGNQRMFGVLGNLFSTLVMMGMMQFVTMLFGFKEAKLTILGKMVLYEDLFSLIFQIILTLLFIATVNFAIPNVKPVRKGHHHGAAAKKPVAAAESSTPASAAGTSASPAPSTESEKSALEVHQVPLEKAAAYAPTPAPPCAYNEIVEESPVERHPVIRLMTSPDFFFFMLFVITAGVVRTVTANFQKVLTAAATEMALDVGSNGAKQDGEAMGQLKSGLTMLSRVFSEIAMYLLAPTFKRMMGYHWILVASQLIGIVRLVLYAVVSIGKSWTFTAHFVIELLKGFSSGLIGTSAVNIAKDLAPAGCEASAQSLYAGIYTGLSTMLAGLMSAVILFYKLNAMAATIKPTKPQLAEATQYLFGMVGVITTIATVLMAAKFIFIDRVMGIPGFPRRQSLSNRNH